jgi:mycofactocin system glycosyltransferase
LDSVQDSRPAEGTAEAASMLQLLRDYEMIHPSAAPDPLARDRVSFVIPARNAGGRIAPMVTALMQGAAAVVVVDDASTDETATAARDAGATVVTQPACLGPAAARNSGLARVETELVAFMDDDCEPDGRWVGGLAQLFEDTRLALAAPRVTSAPGNSVVARYEQACSPLDMGPEPGVVGRGRRLSYVPSAAVLARAAALREVGGFDPGLRVGEDVDLVWRLDRAGWRMRYAPTAVVIHHPRETLVAAWSQRYSYGRSTTPLEARHPRATRPLHLSRTSVFLWLTCLTGPRGAASGVVAATAPAALGTRDRRSARAAIGLAARGHAAASTHLGRALVREWLPVTLMAAGASRRMRRALALALAVDVIAARRGAHSTIGWPAFALLRAAENAAYCAGSWSAALEAGSTAALLPTWLRKSERRG